MVAMADAHGTALNCPRCLMRDRTRSCGSVTWPGTCRGLGDFDHTYAFLREGYDFISNRCAALGSDVFRARLMLRKVTCMRGASAAEVFYGSDRFTRRGAMPLTVLMLLQDFGSVQMLDGKAHRHRKAMFTAIGRPQAADDLATQFTEEWRRTVPRWSRMQSIILFTELEELLTRAGASWAGVPMSEDDLKQRTREYSEMLAATGSFGPRTFRALLLRRRTERWAQGVIRQARSGKIECRPDFCAGLDSVAPRCRRPAAQRQDRRH